MACRSRIHLQTRPQLFPRNHHFVVPIISNGFWTNTPKLDCHHYKGKSTTYKQSENVILFAGLFLLRRQRVYDPRDRQPTTGSHNREEEVE
jgi:hypothetical protein